MNVLVLGAGGFVGRNVLEAIKADPRLTVASGSRVERADYRIDLLDRGSILDALDKFRPDVIINCAGIVANTDQAYKNVEFCRNIFEAIISHGGPFPKVVISGSAAVYGEVKDAKASVVETTPLRAISDYGKSKIEEESQALEYAKARGIDVVVARIFNPIGPGMGEKFLLTNLLNQLHEVKAGIKNEITVSRHDSLRDYIDVRDVASAIYLLATAKTGHDVYNVGSGNATSNGELIDRLLNHVELGEKPTIIETRDTAEPAYAARADIARLQSDFGWKPKYSIDDTVEDTVNAEKSDR